MFKVIDTQTGTWADPESIAISEEWAKGLIYCDMEGFARLEDGSLILVDECGSFKYCPQGRFQIVEAVEQLRAVDCALCHCSTAVIHDGVHCANCGRVHTTHSH